MGPSGSKASAASRAGGAAGARPSPTGRHAESHVATEIPDAPRASARRANSRRPIVPVASARSSANSGAPAGVSGMRGVVAAADTVGGVEQDGRRDDDQGTNGVDAGLDVPAHHAVDDQGGRTGSRPGAQGRDDEVVER